MMRQKITTAVLGLLMLLILTACENNTKKNAGTTDTDNTDTSADNAGDSANTGPSLSFIVTTDFSVGNLSTLTTTAPRTMTKDVLGSTGVSGDSVIRTFGDLVFILQRFGANSIIVLDPDDPIASIANYSTNDANTTGQQSDPHDMAFVSLSKAYVSRYGLNTVLIVNPRTGEQLGLIDLSQFLDPSDGDGLVEMDQMIIVKGKLYIALQRLDMTQPFGSQAAFTSFLVVVDTVTDTVLDLDPTSPGIQAIELKGRNPFGDMVFLSKTNRIYLAHAGNFFVGQSFGGIESIDPSSNTSQGIIISDSDFGSSIGTFAILSETIAYATVFDASFNNIVLPFDLKTLKVDSASPLAGLGSTFIMSLAFSPEGFLYVADRDATKPGIQIFFPTTNQKLEGPIDTGLPPAKIVFTRLQG